VARNLVIASEYGHVEIVAMLLAHGAEVNLREALVMGKAALITAIDEGHEEIVRLLLDNGADMELQTEECLTALRAAAEAENIEIVKILVDSGASIDAKSRLLLGSSKIANMKGTTEKDKLKAYMNGPVTVKKRLFSKLVKNKDNWPTLFRGLEVNGDPDLANSFIKESMGYWFGKGQPLFDAGINWAHDHGCGITKVNRAGKVYYILHGCYGY